MNRILLATLAVLLLVAASAFADEDCNGVYGGVMQEVPLPGEQGWPHTSSGVMWGYYEDFEKDTTNFYWSGVLWIVPFGHIHSLQFVEHDCFVGMTIDEGSNDDLFEGRFE